MGEYDIKEARKSGQPIYWYVVDVMWQSRRGKKSSIHKWKELECVSRAKTMHHLNKDHKALEFLEGQTKLTAKKENFRVYHVVSQKIVGYSEHYKERDYDQHFK